jgi:hypothetical protein
MTEPAGAPTQEVTEEDTKSAAGRVLASVLDLPGIAGVVEPLLEPFGKALLALAQPLDAVSSTAGIALRLVGVAASQTAREEPSVSEVIARESGPSTEPDAPGPDPTPPPWPEIIADLMVELAEHVAANDVDLRREARAALRELGEELTGLRALAVTAPGGNGLPNEIVTRVTREIAKRAAKLIKIMRRLDNLFGKIAAPRFRLALKLLKAELLGPAQHRAIIGALMSVPGFLADLAMEVRPGAKEAPSSRSLGNEAHEHLQREYRNHWTSPKFVDPTSNPFVRGAVVQDGLAYYFSIVGVPLARAAKSRRDGSLYALLFARLPERVVRQFVGDETMDNVWSMYREDVLDMRTGEVWEIKPMRSTALGVYQELQYRHSFNLVNAMLLDVRDMITAGGSVAGKLGKRAKFLTGLQFSREAPLIGGLDLNWMPIKRAFVVGRKSGRPLLAVPMTVPQLPGLLLYVLLRVPTAALAVLAGVLAKQIADLLEKLARDYAKRVEYVLYVLVEAIKGALMGLAFLAIAFLFWYALAGGAAAEALVVLGRLIMQFAPALGAVTAVPALLPGAGDSGAPGGGAASGPRSLLQQLMEFARAEKLELLAPPTVVGDELVVQLAPVKQEGRGQGMPVIDIAVTNVRVCGLPASARPIVDALAQIAAAVGAGVFAEFLGEKPVQA